MLLICVFFKCKKLKTFEVPHEVLSRDPNSLLCQLTKTNDVPILIDPDGCYYFDRDWWVKYVMHIMCIRRHLLITTLDNIQVAFPILAHVPSRWNPSWRQKLISSGFIQYWCIDNLVHCCFNFIMLSKQLYREAAFWNLVELQRAIEIRKVQNTVQSILSVMNIRHRPIILIFLLLRSISFI